MSLADLTWAVKRHAPDRIVVGEVRGPEVMFMLEAACDGIAGTLCTLHARSSHQTFEKLVNYARRDGASYDRTDVLQTAAYALDLIVYLDQTPTGAGWSPRSPRCSTTTPRPADHHQRLVRAGPDGDAVRNPNSPHPGRHPRPAGRARLRADAPPRRGGW